MVSSLDLKALNIFLNGPITHDMIHKLVVATLQVIPCKDTKSQTYTTTNNTVKQLPSLMTFLTKLIKYTNVYTGTLMATLIYLQKLKTKLPKNAQGLPCTRHRILLSCLILSSKFHNDSSPKNKHWAKYTDGLFNVKDINLMERQLIYLLNWDLKVTNEEMVEVLGSFLEPVKAQIIKSEKIKLWKQQQAQQQQLYATAATTSTATAAASSNTTPASAYLTPSPSRSNSVSPSSSSSSSSTSLYNQLHYRQDSQSSITSISSSNSSNSLYSTRSNSSSGTSTCSVSPLPPTSSSSTSNNVVEKKPQQNQNQYVVDPLIEFAAMKEEIELNNLLKKFNKSTI
ncbi:PCL1 [Candida margitis]|uniref:PCL1 n=1 Tax=Candida margitis TaxID=1775924 RepID=UPI0022279590|nr:PCL1 [Candida margitis]KAI5970307.1 PCL1 [Candida margitis]